MRWLGQPEIHKANLQRETKKRVVGAGLKSDCSGPEYHPGKFVNFGRQRKAQ